MTSTKTLLHLIYIHGFQGNDTTFQSFPTHLQQYLSTRIPCHLDITIQSSLYPTYKSAKPISHATRNFLEWLKTQPPGPVILLGHSMGGLLAAEAATALSNNPDEYPGAKPHRIVGMIAFDCPYLGLHPHVIVTGVASLMPRRYDKQRDKLERTENCLNDTRVVNIVDSKVTEDWDSFRGKLDKKQSRNLIGSNKQASKSSPSIASPQDSSVALKSPSPLLSKMDRARALIHSDDPMIRWLWTHSHDPLSSGMRWVIERLQFGICVFDPAGLRDRYAKLVAWKGGLWVNYWTQTRSRPRRIKSESSGQDGASILAATGVTENDAALAESLTVHPAQGDAVSPLQKKPEKDHLKAFMKTIKKCTTRDRTKERPGNNFVVLPTGLSKFLGGSDNWVRVPIEGAEDEVEGHCGLFLPHHNLDYVGFVERVGERVIGWCEDIHRRVKYDQFQFGR